MSETTELARLEQLGARMDEIVTEYGQIHRQRPPAVQAEWEQLWREWAETDERRAAGLVCRDCGRTGIWSGPTDCGPDGCHPAGRHPLSEDGLCEPCWEKDQTARMRKWA